jgi:hypothetical protein
MKLNRLVPAALLLSLTGCADPFIKYYSGMTPEQILASGRVDTASAVAPAIYNYSADAAHDEQALMENGYAKVGASSFNTGQRVSKSQLLEQAKTLNAAVILTSSHFTGSVTSALPMTTYHPGAVVTSNTSGNVNMYGSNGGSAYGNYSGTTTTQLPGTTSTQYIPYTVNRFDYLATYWVKLKPGHFGAQVQDLPDDLRAKLQRNTGAIVVAVVNGSPAFKANILRGDVILAVNGVQVEGAKQGTDLMLSLAGQTVQVLVQRGDEQKAIAVTETP